ncbi:MAG: molybdopterin-dependent oxidoreductase, partial [Bacteroidota bacterium]
MSDPKPEHIQALTPEAFTGIRITAPKTKAAGIPGVNVALQHSFAEMGFSKAFQTLLKLNQTKGFDCPGCAWPDPDPKDRSSIAEYCENGVKAVAEEATRKTLDASFFRQHSVAELSEWSDYQLGRSGRLVEPMIIREGERHYQPISWDEAFQTIAREMHALDHPDEAVFYTSGRASNEAAFTYQLFV